MDLSLVLSFLFVLVVVLVVLQVVQFLFFKHKLKEGLPEEFKLLATQALVENNPLFVEQAKTTLEKFFTVAQGELKQKQHAIIDPVTQYLGKHENEMKNMELTREKAYAGLRQYIEGVSETSSELRKETGNLVKALTASDVRGKWGELNLQRVVELAGMVEHCDFTTQPSLSTEDSQLRPDVIVKLPNQRRVVIDAKVPLNSYLKSVEAEDEKDRKRFLKEHSRQLKDHIQKLESKSYWEYLEGSPEFVVLYIPLESLYSSALRSDPDLMEKAMQHRVFIATPTILIAMLKSIHHGWNQEKLAHNAEQISAMGKELHDRLSTMTKHFVKVGDNLKKARTAYDATYASFNSRVLVTARGLKKLGVSTKEEIPEVNQVDSDLP